MEQLTVKKLKIFCDKAIKEGHGDKYIVVADDNEGNVYHGMFYGFSDAMEMEADAQVFGHSIEDQIYDSCYSKPEEIIILG